MAKTIKVMTFNLRVAVACDGINHFDRRLPRIVEFLDTESPDLIGFQEVNLYMKECLHEQLPDYVLIGCGRERDFGGESALIAYKKDRFELIRFENFWLSATPRVPGSRYGFDCTASSTIVFTEIYQATHDDGQLFDVTRSVRLGFDPEAKLIGITFSISEVAVSAE